LDSMETALVKFDWWDLDQVRDRGLVFVSHISEKYSKTSYQDEHYVLWSQAE